MLAIAIDFLKRYPRSIGATLLLVAVVGTARVHVRVERHARETAVATADTVATLREQHRAALATQRTLDSLRQELVQRDVAVATARAATDQVTAHAARVLAGHEATDALYASLTALSAPAQADTTVQAVTRATRALVAENGAFRRTITDLVATAATERTQDEARHDADTATMHGLAAQVASARTELAAESARPKRTKKAMAAAGLIGHGLLRGLEYVAQHALDQRKH